MTYEEQLNLIDYLIRMGFDREFVIWTLINCEEGKGIGTAMSLAVDQMLKRKKFPSESDE